MFHRGNFPPGHNITWEFSSMRIYWECVFIKICHMGVCILLLIFYMFLCSFPTLINVTWEFDYGRGGGGIWEYASRTMCCVGQLFIGQAVGIYPQDYVSRERMTPIFKSFLNFTYYYLFLLF